jgi:hypothetical protein
LDAYGAIRRPVVKEVVALTDRLTWLAAVSRRFRPLHNALLGSLARAPAFGRRLAWRLARLAFR